LIPVFCDLELEHMDFLSRSALFCIEDDVAS
jgi:hypothetical protein